MKTESLEKTGKMSLDGTLVATGAASARYLAACKARLVRVKAEKAELEMMSMKLRRIMSSDKYLIMLLGPDTTRTELSASIKNLVASRSTELALVSDL